MARTTDSARRFFDSLPRLHTVYIDGLVISDSSSGCVDSEKSSPKESIISKKTTTVTTTSKGVMSFFSAKQDHHHSSKVVDVRMAEFLCDGGGERGFWSLGMSWFPNVRQVFLCVYTASPRFWSLVLKSMIQCTTKIEALLIQVSHDVGNDKDMKDDEKQSTPSTSSSGSSVRENAWYLWNQFTRLKVLIVILNRSAPLKKQIWFARDPAKYEQLRSQENYLDLDPSETCVRFFD